MEAYWAAADPDVAGFWPRKGWTNVELTVVAEECQDSLIQA
jgi:hypothetical protein